VWPCAAMSGGEFRRVTLAPFEAKVPTRCRRVQKCAARCGIVSVRGLFVRSRSSTDALDLCLGAHPLRSVEVVPHARVVAQQRGRAAAELLGDVLRPEPRDGGDAQL
jgi:hypothetical protein